MVQPPTILVLAGVLVLLVLAGVLVLPVLAGAEDQAEEYEPVVVVVVVAEDL